MENIYSVSAIKKIVSKYAVLYGADRVYLFGSYARGDMSPISDIDLRIDKGSIRGLEFAALLGDLQDAFGKNVDLISTTGMDTDFLSSIHDEEVLLYERQ